MTTTQNVSADSIQPFAIGGNALQMGPINMQGIVGSQGPENLINKNSDWHMQSSASINPSTGDVVGYCHTWTTNSGVPWGQGFHGSVTVTFKDATDALVGFLPAQRYGVCGGWDYTGPHSRLEQFPGHVDLLVLGTVTQIGYVYVYDPKSDFLSQLENELVQSLKQPVAGLVQLVEQNMGGVIAWVAASL
jgi:hypothetical protein